MGKTVVKKTGRNEQVNVFTKKISHVWCSDGSEKKDCISRLTAALKLMVSAWEFHYTRVVILNFQSPATHASITVYLLLRLSMIIIIIIPHLL